MPSQSERATGLTAGDLYRSKRDGGVFEVHYVSAGWRDREPRVQLKPARAKNLKKTRWLDLENLPKLYDKLEENDDPVSMNDLDWGDVWELTGGKRVEVLDRAFLWGGKRWVAVLDHDFDAPSVFEVNRFNGGRCINAR